MLSILAVIARLEDQVSIRSVLSAHRNTMSVIIAGSVAEAEDSGKTISFDLVIADETLADGSGVALRKLCGDKSPLVVIIEDADHSLISRLVRKGAFDVLVRSQGHIADLPACINTIMRNRLLAVAEQDLSRAETFDESTYLQLVNHAGIPIVLCKLNGTIAVLNAWASMSFGGTPNELTGRNIVDLFPATQGSMIMARLSRVIRTGSGIEIEEELTVHGEDRRLLANYQPVFDHQGAISSIQIIWQDVTDRTAMEKKLKAQVTELETINQLAIGRELRMIELKEEINTLLEKSGSKPRYIIHHPRYPDASSPARNAHG